MQGSLRVFSDLFNWTACPLDSLSFSTCLCARTREYQNLFLYVSDCCERQATRQFYSFYISAAAYTIIVKAIQYDGTCCQTVTISIECGRTAPPTAVHRRLDNLACWGCDDLFTQRCGDVHLPCPDTFDHICTFLVYRRVPGQLCAPT